MYDDVNWKALAERMLFDFGKGVLGRNAGGLIAKMKNSKGIEGAWQALMAAYSKQDPREFAAATMKESSKDVIEHGTVLGSCWFDAHSGLYGRWRKVGSNELI